MSSGSSSSSSSSSSPSKKSATDREVEFARKHAETEESRNAEITERINGLRERNRAAFESSEQGAVHRQIDEAERDMRGPSPAPGFVEGDPLKGPST
jgi:hypothetical protein